MGVNPMCELMELLDAYETAKVERMQGVVHTCRGFVHFIPSGTATVKVFLTKYPDFDTDRDSQLPAKENT